MNSRRNFLQKLAASAIAFPLLPNLDIDPKDNSDTRHYEGPVLHVAIMGLGS